MQQRFILLKKGDTLILTRDLYPGEPAVYDQDGTLLGAARIGCTLPEVFSDVRPGERIWLDDGKIGGVIQSVQADQIRIQISHARECGDKLRADKGINLPDSELRIPPLTRKDIEDLPFIVANADVVDQASGFCPASDSAGSPTARDHRQSGARTALQNERGWTVKSRVQGGVHGKFVHGE